MQVIRRHRGLWLIGEFLLAIAVSLVPVLAVGELNESTYAAGLLLAAVLLLPAETYRQFWLGQRRHGTVEAEASAEEAAPAEAEARAAVEEQRIDALADFRDAVKALARDQSQLRQEVLAMNAAGASPAAGQPADADGDALRREVQELRAAVAHLLAHQKSGALLEKIAELKAPGHVGLGPMFYESKLFPFGSGVKMSPFGEVELDIHLPSKPAKGAGIKGGGAAKSIPPGESKLASGEKAEEPA